MGVVSQEGMEVRTSSQASRPWDPRKGESGAAYEAFLLYRDLGPRRSVVGVARRLGRCPSLCYRWSARHGWAERARAWDLSQARAQEQVRREMREEVRRACLRRGQQLAELGWARLVGVVGRDPVTGEVRFAADFGTKEALRAVVEGVKMQAAASGELPAGESEGDLLGALLQHPDATLQQVHRVLAGGQRLSHSQEIGPDDTAEQ